MKYDHILYTRVPLSQRKPEQAGDKTASSKQRSRITVTKPASKKRPYRHRCIFLSLAAVQTRPLIHDIHQTQHRARPRPSPLRHRSPRAAGTAESSRADERGQARGERPKHAARGGVGRGNDGGRRYRLALTAAP